MFGLAQYEEVSMMSQSNLSVILEDFLSSSSKFIPTLLTGGHVSCWTGLPVISSLCNSGLDHLIDSAIDVSLQEFSWPAQKFAGQREERFLQTGMKMKLPEFGV